MFRGVRTYERGAGVVLLAGWQTERMVVCPTLETDRLVLRPFRDDDLADYFAMMDSPEVRTAMRIPDGAGMPEAFDAMAAWLGQWALRGTGHWALEEKDSGQFVGSAGLHRPERHDWPGVEVGWTLHPSQWGVAMRQRRGRRRSATGSRNSARNDFSVASCLTTTGHRQWPGGSGSN